MINCGDLLGLLTLIHEGRDVASYPIGSKERDIIKRFSVLCPSSASRRDSVTSRLSAKSSHNKSVEDGLPAATLPSPSLTNFESPGDLQWLPALWDSLQEFTVDIAGPELLQSPPDIARGDEMVLSSDTWGFSRSRLTGSSPTLDAFECGFLGS